jgi:DNA ligase 1
MEQQQDLSDDKTVSIDQDTVIVDPNDDFANDSDLPKIEISDVTLTTNEPEEEEKIDLSQARRSQRKRKRGDLNEYTNGDEFSSSEDEKEEPAEKGKRKINRQFQGVMLAEKYTDEDIDGWIMSEKLDGVRCVWNGKTMKTRNNNTFYPPKFFSENFPDEILDGELWMERAKFQETVSIVRKSYAHDGWKNIKYVVFDGPELGGNFKTRLRKLEKIFKDNNSEYVQLHEHEVCKDKEHLDDEMKRVIALGGEGMMIRDPNSNYEYRRSDRMLKVKQAYDAEAVVLQKIKGTGRCSNMMGALLCRNNDGIEFKVGSGFTDVDRRNPPKLGSIITYKYYETTKSGKPRFPIYLRPHPGM